MRLPIDVMFCVSTVQGNRHVHHLMHIYPERRVLKQQGHVFSLFEVNDSLYLKLIWGGSNVPKRLWWSALDVIYKSPTPASCLLITNPHLFIFFPPINLAPRLHNFSRVMKFPHSSICQIPSSCQVITGRRRLFNIHNHVSLTFSKGSQSQSPTASSTARA